MSRSATTCPDPARHTGGRHHSGHDNCIQAQKQRQAEERSTRTVPERTRQYRINPAYRLIADTRQEGRNDAWYNAVDSSCSDTTSADLPARRKGNKATKKGRTRKNAK